MKELWMVALPQILCQLHDHARQYDNDDVCHDKWNGGKLHGNISRGLDAPAKFAPILKVRKGNARYRRG